MVPNAGLTMVVRTGKHWGGAGSLQDTSKSDCVAAEGVQVPRDTISALFGAQRGRGGRGWLKVECWVILLAPWLAFASRRNSIGVDRCHGCSSSGPYKGS